MGLDQDAYIKNKKGEKEYIHYWRKHNALDGWMEALWRTKGNDGSWNCSELELTKADLDKLEDVVKRDALPETHGFFYGGDSRQSAYQKKETLKFILEAKYLLDEGEKVFYSAWF